MPSFRAVRTTRCGDRRAQYSGGSDSWAVRQHSVAKKLFRCAGEDTLFAISRPCRLHHIPRCSAPCVSLIAPGLRAESIARCAPAGQTGDIMRSSRPSNSVVDLNSEASAVRDQIVAWRRFMHSRRLKLRFRCRCGCARRRHRRSARGVNLAIFAAADTCDKPNFPARSSNATSRRNS